MVIYLLSNEQQLSLALILKEMLTLEKMPLSDQMHIFAAILILVIPAKLVPL